MYPGRAARHCRPGAGLDVEIALTDRRWRRVVAESAPRLSALHGVGSETAGQLLTTAGDDPERPRSEAALAHLCGAAPIPASAVSRASSSTAIGSSTHACTLSVRTSKYVEAFPHPRREALRCPVLANVHLGGVMRVPSRNGWITIGAVLLVLIGITILVWPRGRQLPPMRAREYRDVDTCLLTGPAGITDSQAAEVWAGLQDASAATRVRVSYLSVVGPETQANALPFVQSLVQKNCAVIVATGPVEVGAAAGVARDHREIHFVLIGGTRSGDNVVIVAPAGDQLRGRVAGAVENVL